MTEPDPLVPHAADIARTAAAFYTVNHSTRLRGTHRLVTREVAVECIIRLNYPNEAYFPGNPDHWQQRWDAWDQNDEESPVTRWVNRFGAFNLTLGYPDPGGPAMLHLKQAVTALGVWVVFESKYKQLPRERNYSIEVRPEPSQTSFWR